MKNDHAKISPLCSHEWSHLMTNTSKIKSGWGSAPDPTGGAYGTRPLKKFVQAGTLDVMDEIEANELILEFVIIKDHHDAIFCVKSKFD